MRLVGVKAPDNIGAMIQAIRLYKRYSQKQVSVETGITQAALSAIEKGQQTPQPATLKKLDDFFGGRIEDLYKAMQE